jgi:hydrogenase maturation protease
MTKQSILVIGFGNPGRLDDGLGPALVSAIEALKLKGVRVECDYQLSVEDAAIVAQYDFVIFADAATDGGSAFYFHRLEPAAHCSFSTHSVTPAAVLGLAHDLFGAQTVGFLLGIRGHVFNSFGEGLSPEAQANLSAAVVFLHDLLRYGDFEGAVDRATPEDAWCASAREVESC